jgi:hypothetical protein
MSYEMLYGQLIPIYLLLTLKKILDKLSFLCCCDVYLKIRAKHFFEKKIMFLTQMRKKERESDNPCFIEHQRSKHSDPKALFFSLYMEQGPATHAHTAMCIYLNANHKPKPN